MLGLGFTAPLPILKAKITREVKGVALLNFIPVSVKVVEEGFVAEPVLGGSSVLRRLIQANGFIYVDPGGVIEEGKEVDVTLFGVHELSYLYA